MTAATGTTVRVSPALAVARYNGDRLVLVEGAEGWPESVVNVEVREVPALIAALRRLVREARLIEDGADLLRRALGEEGSGE